MRRATTPKHTFTFPESVPIDTVSKIIITYSQCGKTILQKTMPDLGISGNSFVVRLSLEETNKFAPGKALVQVQAQGQNNRVLVSQMIWITVKPVLDSEGI